MIGLELSSTAVSARRRVGRHAAAKNGLSKRFEDTIMQGIGLCTMFIGIGGALQRPADARKTASSPRSTPCCSSFLALGALIGEALNIEKHLEDFGVFCQNRLKSHDDSHFVEGLRQLRCSSASARWRSSARCRTACRATRPCSSRGHHRRHRGGRVRGLARQGRVFLPSCRSAYQERPDAARALHPSVDDRRAHRADVVSARC